MMTKAEEYLNISLEYKKKYKAMSWWKFKKRSFLKGMWYSGRDLAFKELGIDIKL